MCKHILRMIVMCTVEEISFLYDHSVLPQDSRPFSLLWYSKLMYT